MDINDAFRAIRGTWFKIQLEEREAYGESDEDTIRRMKRNTAVRAKYDVQTEAIIEGRRDGPIAPVFESEL